MMYAYFNEMSVIGLSYDDDLDVVIRGYANLLNETMAQGFSAVKYEFGLEGVILPQAMTLKDYCVSHNGKGQPLKVILSTARKPYIEDDDEQVAGYIELEDCKVCVSDGNMMDCYGIAAAYLYGSICVGFNTSPWDKVEYTLRMVIGGKVKFSSVYCLTKPEDFENPSVLDWLNERLDPKLEYTALLPIEKSIKLSPHHGYSELFQLSKKLVKERYIIEVVNSIDHNGYTTSFVSNLPIEFDMLDLTLVDSDRGYSLRVRTVARNKREQKYIAKLLTEKYS